MIPGDDTDFVVLTDGTRLDADLVVLSVGVRPDTAAFEDAGILCERGAIPSSMNTAARPPPGVGGWRMWACRGQHRRSSPDRRPVALAGPANRAGRLVPADHIFHPETARPIRTP